MSYTPNQKAIIKYINQHIQGTTIHDYLLDISLNNPKMSTKRLGVNVIEPIKVYPKNALDGMRLSFPESAKTSILNYISDFYIITRDLYSKGLISLTLDDTRGIIEVLDIQHLNKSKSEDTLNKTELHLLVNGNSEILISIGIHPSNAKRFCELIFPLPGLATFIQNDFQTDSEFQAKQIIKYSKNNLWIAIGAVVISSLVSLYTNYNNSDFRKVIDNRKVIYTEIKDSLLVKQVPSPKDTSKTTVKIDSAKKVSP